MGDLSRFLPAMLHGLSKGEGRVAARSLTVGWLNNGRYLRPIAWYLCYADPLDLDLLTETLDRSFASGDVEATITCIRAAEAQFRRVADERLRNEIFMPAIRRLAAEGEITWVHGAWWMASPILKSLTQDQSAEVLSYLVTQPRVENNVEHLVAAIGAPWPEQVIAFFGSRLRRELGLRDEDGLGKGEDRYEAVPYSLHTVRDVLKKAPAALVEAARGWFSDDGLLYQFRGGRLLADTFRRDFLPEFRDTMLRYVAGSPEDRSFVLRTLSQFEGAAGVSEIVKEIVAHLSEDDPLWQEAMTVMRASGVVRGEYGFVELYTKRKAIVDEWKDDPRAEVRVFAEAFSKKMENAINHERRQADDALALRRLEYGEDVGDLGAVDEDDASDED
jgi:hypothetical protein